MSVINWVGQIESEGHPVHSVEMKQDEAMVIPTLCTRGAARIQATTGRQDLAMILPKHLAVHGTNLFSPGSAQPVSDPRTQSLLHIPSPDLRCLRLVQQPQVRAPVVDSTRVDIDMSMPRWHCSHLRPCALLHHATTLASKLAPDSRPGVKITPKQARVPQATRWPRKPGRWPRDRVAVVDLLRTCQAHANWSLASQFIHSC